MKKNPFSQKRYFGFVAIGGLVSFSGIAFHSLEAIIAGVAIYLICLVGPLLVIHQSR